MPQNTDPPLIGNQNIYLDRGVSKIASYFCVTHIELTYLFKSNSPLKNFQHSFQAYYTNSQSLARNKGKV